LLYNTSVVTEGLKNLRKVYKFFIHPNRFPRIDWKIFIHPHRFAPLNGGKGFIKSYRFSPENSWKRLYTTLQVLYGIQLVKAV
jgi:hypothetical protein